MATLAVLATFLGLGLLHGLGPDHCLAIAALLARGKPERRRAVRVGLSFGLGHALVLATGAILAKGLGLLVPHAWSQRAEAAGGAALVVLGAALIWRALRGGADHGHPHWEPKGAGERRATAGGTGHALLGALFALSGVRALVLLIPLALSGQLWLILLSVALFGVGVILSMSLFGLLFARGLAWAGRTPRGLLWVEAGAGAIATGVGAYWFLANVG